MKPDAPRLLWRLWRLYAPWRGWLLLGLGAGLVTLLAQVTLMAASGWFIAAMAAAGATGAMLNYFGPAALIRASAIARTVGRYAERLVTHDAALRLLSGLRVWLWRHLEPIAPAGLKDLHSGDLLARLVGDIDSLDQTASRTLVPLLGAVAAAVLLTLFVAGYDQGLALVLVAGLAGAGVLVPLWARRQGAAPGSDLVETEARLRTAAVDGLQGLPELLVWGAADRQAERLGELSRELGQAQVRLAGQTGAAAAAIGLAAGLTLCGVLVLAVPLVQAGRLGAPELTMLALLALAAFETVAPLPGAFQHLGVALAAARRLFAVADTPAPVTEPAGPSPSPARFDLYLHGVGYRYPGSDRPALDGIDLALPAGRRVALVGPSGAGKTTLLELLLRFRDPDAGGIELGGRPLGDYAGAEVRRHLALVSQHTHLFNASIRDNLRLARPDATQADLESACRAAQVHAFIADLPEGYDTWVGETGVRLSGGEARRIAVARAILKDAPVLLLDEPTEGLDAPAERALLAAVGRLMAGRTVVLVTHRPWGLRDMDEVLLLDAGRVQARGTFAELLAGEQLPRLLSQSTS